MTDKVIFPSLPSGHTIFCDDVRQEVTGKGILVGVYGTHLYVSEIPSTLPKLCMVVVYRDIPDLEAEVTLRILFEPADSETGEHKTPPQDSFDTGNVVFESTLRKPVDSTPRVPAKGFEMIEARLEFQLAPFNVATPGILKVRAYRDDLEIRLGTLRIEKIDQRDENGTNLDGEGS